MLSANYFVFGKQWRFNVPTVLTIDTRNVTSGGTTSSQFRLPYSGSIDALVDWGDGSKTRVTNSATATHTYDTPGIYDIKIYSSNDSYSLLFYNSLEQLKLIEIKQFGKLLIISNSFRGCSNLTLSQVSDVPNLSTSLSGVFQDCKSLTTINKGNEWDVSNVTYMGGMFNNCTVFNQNLNNWNVSNVTNMSYMFYNSISFNQPLNNWNVSKVTTMNELFRNCTSFNQPLNNWNVSSVTNMNSFMLGKSSANYNATYYDGLLISLDNSGRTNITLGMGSIKYTSAGATARANLIAKSWTITDGGL